jgi:hypothetical protein
MGPSDYKSRTARLVWDDLDLASFRAVPLTAEVLRCVRYMHDVEYHTTCYLRELLLTPAHNDPEITAFLTMWAFEEFWHGEALAAVLTAHDERSGPDRVSSVRRALGWRDHVRPHLIGAAGWAVGNDFVAVHMAWGAVNEWTTQAGYAQLARRAKNPVLSALLARVIRQEARHIEFYARQARARLAASARARYLARAALVRFWHPVGAGFMPVAETEFLLSYLIGGEHGADVARRIDRCISALPGLEGLALVQGVMGGQTGRAPAQGRAAPAMGPSARARCSALTKAIRSSSGSGLE